MQDATPNDPRTRLKAAENRLEGRISRTRLSIALERGVQAFWPLATLAMAGAAGWAFGVAGYLATPLALVAVAAVMLGAAALLVVGLRRFRWPSRGDAVARLDRALPGRPLTALGDTQAVGAGDPASVAVWTRHLERMADAARAARAARPDLRLSPRDPWALRLVALVAIIAAALFARQHGGVALTDVLPAETELQIAAGPNFEAWANPPAYTGKPTIYLGATTQTAFDLPQGTEITLRVYGEAEGYTLEETLSGDASGIAAVAEGIGSAQFTVVQSGRFSLREGVRELGAWDVTLIPDLPPQIALEGEVSRAVSGAMELTYTATDDYGVVSGEASITLDMDDLDRRHGLAVDPEPRDDIVLDLPLPLSGSMDEVEETLVEDLSQHPWAGLPVRIGLTAFDAAAQSGRAEGLTAILPGRRFFDPLAQAIVEQRRDLLWSRENAGRVDQMLRVITHAPEDVFTNRTAFMMTRMALRRLGYASEDGLSVAERDDVAEMLWQVALLIEDGSLSDARERLRRAQDRLSEALRNGATEEEIAELMQELREAMQNYMQQLAQEALQNPQQQQAQNQDGTEITQDQLQELMDRIQELAEQGQTEQAEALLEQLRQLMENLQMQAQQGGGQQGQQGEQTMQELQDTLRQQQDLADESFQQLQREFQQNRQGGAPQLGQPGQPGQQGQGQQGQGQQPGQSPGQGSGQGQGQNPGQGEALSAEQLAQRQEALRQMLEDLRGRLPGPSTPEGQQGREALGEAERQMGEARDNLDEGNLPGALDRQADALDALREGLRGLGEEMQQQAQQNQGPGGNEPGQGQARNDRDPLGRPRGSDGTIRTDDSMLPGISAMERARQLFEEIRRRSSEQNRPSEELDYLRRLLDRF